MKKTIRILGLILLTIAEQLSFCQTNKDVALSKAREAIKLMDSGKIEESIKLLEDAQNLDPDRFDYPYELAYAHYLIEDYKGVIKILEKNINHKGVTERLFQLLGNSYDVLGKTSKAFEAYNAGLQKFPNSGIIYLEKGNVHWNKNEFGEALPYYEKGIEVDPMFPSNYYRASRIFCSSTEEVWGMIYGEIFMNLERNTKRTSEISKLLYDTYKSEIKFTSDSSSSVSFSQNATINIDKFNDTNKMRLPFGIGVYEPTLILSMINEKFIDINSLDRIRKGFIEAYYKKDHNKKFPNILFYYQYKILQLGHLEAYNHWILMKGDEVAFSKWHSINKEKWDIFIKWFSSNGLKIDTSNNFYRGQY
jgi:tetratricopeptide (TPR) repeat protein